ncbi:glycosyltransferase [Mycobacterium sp. ITM-2016-00318]|uniref:glycosyltransferase n=1 Tax=Mycobacterium sp. ITM-2016-00318 TaxID=2099693 RepID=UPI000CF93F32|nr:nucleotide disphospho-sugar-binding domain-containing protein [Mycobacterium sp. ITM-2016-00318]WNG93805.1 glycosyltransferase [Mycobacterium sp. ITM-2016-00318]
MKVLFAMVDGGGNIPPQLAVARALRARGIEVHVLGHRGIRDRVEAAGLAFEPFTEGRHFDPTVARSLPAIMTAFTRVAADRRLGQSVIEAALRHDVDAVVVDMILVAGISEIVGSGIPTVVFVHCFYRAVQDMEAGPVGWALRLRGTNPLAAEHNGQLHVVSARVDLDPMRGRPPVCHTGVVWQGEPQAAVPASVPRILVSLSTCAFAGQRRMLQNILDAVAPLPIEATVTVGPAIDADGLRVPANASLHEWLDHDEVLATASLVVGHGGHSTAMRALSFGVPQIVMPANPMIDQKIVGAALEKAGAGLLLTKHARPQRIRAAIQAVLRDEAYRCAAHRLGEQIRQRDGAEVAADAIIEYVRTSHLVES